MVEDFLVKVIIFSIYWVNLLVNIKEITYKYGFKFNIMVVYLCEVVNISTKIYNFLVLLKNKLFIMTSYTNNNSKISIVMIYLGMVYTFFYYI